MTIQHRTETVPQAAGNGPPLDLSWLTSPEWMHDALCAQTDPEIFFPDKGGSTREAKGVCARCPVAAECLDYALSDEQTSYTSPFYFGIWGGTSERERRTIRKQLDQETP